MNNTQEKLFCKTGGCGAKIGPAALNRVLSKIEKHSDPNLLVGFDSADDAAVYKINEHEAFVQTLDFFPPMVDDPYTFGQIAAANALSDIYAMGATVKTALNIVCFPQDGDLNILGKIIMGGADKVSEAGGVLCGGHSINDNEIKYGLSVTGLIDPQCILRNNLPKVGDVLILTKPLGVGIVNCAKTAGLASKESIDAAIKNMTTLNKNAADVIKSIDKVHACTDVTGFGLLGHINEMLNNKTTNSLVVKIDSSKINFIQDSYDLAKDFLITAAGQRNRNSLGANVYFNIDDYAIEELLFDPQTSGGLLFSVAKSHKDEALQKLKDADVDAFCFGEIEKLKLNTRSKQDINIPKIIVT